MKTMKEVKLTIRERLLLISFLNSFQGSLSDVKQAMSVIDKCEISDEEADEIDLLREPNNNVRWDQDKAKEKSIELSRKEIGVLESAIKRRDEENRFSVQDRGILKLIEKLNLDI